MVAKAQVFGLSDCAVRLRERNYWAPSTRMHCWNALRDPEMAVGTFCRAMPDVHAEKLTWTKALMAKKRLGCRHTLNRRKAEEFLPTTCTARHTLHRRKAEEFLPAACSAKMTTPRGWDAELTMPLLSDFGRGISFEFQRKRLIRRGREQCWRARASETESGSSQNQIIQKAAETLHLTVSLAAFLALDMFLKERFLAVGIQFPSALFGMFCIFVFLNIADAVKPQAATAIISFFQPAISFIQRWLPLFYVPSLVVVPLAVKGIPAAAAGKIAFIFVGGWAATLAVAGYTSMAARSIVKTEMQPVEYTPKPSPFADWELKAFGFAAVLTFALAVYSPFALGTIARTASPFFLCVTALGYVFGSKMPEGFKKVFHPIISCALTANIATLVYGSVTKIGYEQAMRNYLTKLPSNLGAGDLLMGVLGSVILSFAFSMFFQRKLVKRHATEIFSAVIAAGVFSMYFTAAAGRLLGLSSRLTLAIVPRCVTVALALPIASLLQASNPSLTAAVVVMTGLIGANFTQLVMDKLKFNDPITRGMATASSAHGLGTAALSAKEPEALPFCAIAYALTGIFCSVLVSVPAIQRSLIYLAGPV